MPTDSDVEKLRKQVRKAFQMRALTISKEAMEYAVQILLELEDEEQIRLINKVIGILSKQNASVPVFSFNEFKSAVTQCVTNQSSKQELLIRVIDLFTAPRLRYNEQRKMLAAVDGQASAIGKSSDAKHLYRERLKFVIQRAVRSSRFDDYQLYTVEALLGSPEETDNSVLLGMLTQKSPGVYEIEDLTGAIEVDLKEATFHKGLFTDGCIMMLEGRCVSGIFRVSAVGLAPIENAKITRNYFGVTNWFGGESTVACGSQIRLRTLCERNDRTRFILMSDVWLDDSRILNAINELIFAFTDSQLLAFIICGNFCSQVGTADTYHRIYDGFRHLAGILQKDIFVGRNVHFIFVPGPDDPSLNSILPRPPLPFQLFELMKDVSNCSFASNPCRIQYTNQEIVIMRYDLIEKMCRNSIHMPSITADIPEHFCHTIASVGHLSPLPLHISPVLWQMDSYLTLYPLPDLVIIADKFEHFHYQVENTIFINPGSFARTDLNFYVYYPALRTVEVCSADQKATETLE
ncbi:DNA polymerase epsilon subunit [Dirofilaria immitis]